MQTSSQVTAIIGCIGVDINATKSPNGFKCELIAVKTMAVDAAHTLAVNLTQNEGPFGEMDLFPVGRPAALTKDNWPVVKAAITESVDNVVPNGTWHSPFVGLRAEFPANDAICPGAKYVILMNFDTKRLELYSGGTLIGNCPIKDSQQWRDIVTNAGISLASTSSASN